MTDNNDKQREEFEKIYAQEYADGPVTAPEPKPASTPSDPPDDSNATEAPESAPEATPPAKTANPTTSTETSSEASTESPAQVVDKWAALDPEIKEAFERERRAAQAAVGRTAFLNRELDKLRSTTKNPQPQEHLPKVNETPAEKKVRLEKLEKLRETDPEYASTIDELLENLDRRHVEEVGKWQEQVTPLQQHVQKLELALEETRMDQAAPDWREAVNSIPFQEWQQLKLPPDERQALGTYTRAKDLLPYIQAFKQDWAIYQASLQQQEQAAPTPSQPDTTQADKVAQDRARKLQQPVVGPSSVPRPNVKPVNLSDPEAMRKVFDEQYAKEFKT